VVLKWSLVITLLFVVVQVAAGFQAHSLALLSDAGHNFTDALALLLAWFGYFFATKPANEVKTYGYHRAGVLAAFVNALTLLGLAGLIIYESWHRFRNPQTVREGIMIAVAGVGLAVNLVIMYGLRRDRTHDLNVRSAWAHMLGDALGSVGIIAGGFAIRATGWQQIDALLSVAIALLIIWTAWDIIKEALNILLEGLPKGLSLDVVRQAILGVDGVRDVHDLHIWSLAASTHALSCHVLVGDMPMSAGDAILTRLNQVLYHRFQIHHSTVQLEFENCAHAPNGCAISLPSSGARVGK